MTKAEMPEPTASGLPDNGLDLPVGIYRDVIGGQYVLLAVSRHTEAMNWLVTYVVLNSPRGNTVWSMPVQKWRALRTFVSTNPNEDY